MLIIGLPPSKNVSTCQSRFYGSSLAYESCCGFVEDYYVFVRYTNSRLSSLSEDNRPFSGCRNLKRDPWPELPVFHTFNIGKPKAWIFLPFALAVSEWGTVHTMHVISRPPFSELQIEALLQRRTLNLNSTSCSHHARHFKNASELAQHLHYEEGQLE